MWPWGHAALGYVLFSVVVRTWPGRRVSDGPVLALLVATQFPDLIDKPLGWGFGIVPSGYSVGHSVFVAVPVGLALWAALSIWADRPVVGLATVVGWWSHLVGDVLFAVVTNQQITIGRVLWPVVMFDGTPLSGGVFDRIGIYLSQSVEFVLNGGPPLVVILMVGTPVAALVLWVADGTPVLSGTVRWIRPHGG